MTPGGRVQKLCRPLGHGQPKAQRTGLPLVFTCGEGLPPH